ncbi:MAG: hypothetical protein IT371_25560 [Deltaproteobacteria bacterium]|nr:hypothetical protein [Deltaproteobacteria bacterium]
MRRWTLFALLASVPVLPTCRDEQQFARVVVIDDMAQVIGGPAAQARVGDFLLENDRLRAVVHGRHNQRSTFPISNGSLVDLDIQRPADRYGVGKGSDAFYELGPMVNLKVSGSGSMQHGACDAVGASPCPRDPDGRALAGCVRVSGTGKGENIMGVLGLLDLAILKNYPADELEIVNDYDLCPGETFVRITTTARFYGKGAELKMAALNAPASILDIMLGENTGVDCARAPCPSASPHCDDLLKVLEFGSLKTEMKRCRSPAQKLAGLLGGDFMLFSGKVHVFIPGSGFDHETYIRSLFDAGGDVFSNPLSLDYVTAIGPGVSYAYFADGTVSIPVFSEAFTAAITNRFACPRSNKECFKGNELRFTRYVGVGDGSGASALEGYYRLRKIPTGELRGHVVDYRTRKPVSGLDVVAYGLPKSWAGLDDAAIARKGYVELAAAHRDESRTALNPAGHVGAISHFLTDSGLDSVKDGSFEGRLPAGRYVLVAAEEGRAISSLVPLTMGVGQSVKALVVAGESGTLQYAVREASGRLLPSKITLGQCFVECARNEDCGGPTPVCDGETGLCRPSAGYQGPGDCRPDQRWDAAARTCRCPSVGKLPLELGGRRYADGTVRVEQAGSGQGQLELPPGVYQAVISRGVEYELHKQYVTITPGLVSRVTATLPRVVDTRGWIGADFHVHGPNSVDSGLTHEARVISYATEGVELITATDHDQLTDYAPTIRRLNLAPWVRSQVGVEISPLDYGHFIGFPLRFDETAELKGGFHWRKPFPGGDPDWVNMPPVEIFKNLRERGSLGPDRTVVFVAHYYDHFSFYGIDPWTLELPPLSVTAFFNRVLMPANFSGNFDAVELFNGKNLDLIRRPTWKEIRTYNNDLATLLGDGKLSAEERLRRWIRLSSDAQREFMRRTPSEQKLALSGAGKDFQCRCTADADCGGTTLCDERTGACTPGCADNGGCDAKLVQAGREACQPKNVAEPARKVCQRVTTSCAGDEQCTVTWAEGKVKERCLPDPTGGLGKRCELACTGDADCKSAGDALRPVCEPKSGRCVAEAPAAAASDEEPCPTLRGTVDDWFVMLNRGIRRPALGNSDSHGTYSGEAGLPRTYVRASGELPSQITPEEVADQVKQMQALSTYGPFVEFSVNGQALGSTVKVKKGETVQLKVRVQSPRWFDVDRIEIYANGELIKEITGRTNCPPGATDCIRVPNDSVVNFDGTLLHTPQRDTWYAVVAQGLDGKPMSPVYSSSPVARLGVYELIQRLTPLLPPLRSLRTPLSPSITIVRPYALTNPIWVDVGGDGFSPPQSLPSWATERDRAAVPGGVQASSRHAADGHTHGPGQAAHEHPPSPTSGPEAPAHDHRRGLGRYRADATELVRLAKQGRLTAPMLQQALDQLRFFSH